MVCVQNEWLIFLDEYDYWFESICMQIVHGNTILHDVIAFM